MTKRSTESGIGVIACHHNRSTKSSIRKRSSESVPPGDFAPKFKIVHGTEPLSCKLENPILTSVKVYYE